MEYISVHIAWLLLDVQQKTGINVTNARLYGGRWQVYSGHWQDLSSFLKGAA